MCNVMPRLCERARRQWRPCCTFCSTLHCSSYTLSVSDLRQRHAITALDARVVSVARLYAKHAYSKCYDKSACLSARRSVCPRHACAVLESSSSRSRNTRCRQNTSRRSAAPSLFCFLNCQTDRLGCQSEDERRASKYIAALFGHLFPM